MSIVQLLSLQCVCHGPIALSLQLAGGMLWQLSQQGFLATNLILECAGRGIGVGALGEGSEWSGGRSGVDEEQTQTLKHIQNKLKTDDAQNVNWVLDSRIGNLLSLTICTWAA